MLGRSFNGNDFGFGFSPWCVISKSYKASLMVKNFSLQTLIIIDNNIFKKSSVLICDYVSFEIIDVE